MSRYRFIAAEKAYHSVVLMCRALSVAKSAFYAWQKQQLRLILEELCESCDRLRTELTPHLWHL